MLICKSHIIHHLKENGFVDCYKKENLFKYGERVFFVICKSRRRKGWFKIFVSHKTKSYIIFNMDNMVYYKGDGVKRYVKLYRENFNLIDSILNEFIGEHRKFSDFTKIIQKKW